MNNLKIEKEIANKILYLNEQKIIKSSSTDVTELEKLSNIKTNGTNTEFLAGDGNYVDILIDNLTSDDNTKALTANQGKILNDKITTIEENIGTVATSLDNINGEEI